MKMLKVRANHVVFTSVALVCCIMVQSPVSAQPFGTGKFGEVVPFGSATAIGISLSGSVGMTLAPSGPNFSGSGSHTITVTSTDVIGYKLYVNATSSTSMSNGTSTIPRSTNGTPATLAVNSWGYNTSGSTSAFTGMTLSQVEIKSATGPYENGNNTSVTYGALVDITKSSGTYTVDVTYTAVGQT